MLTNEPDFITLRFEFLCLADTKGIREYDGLLTRINTKWLIHLLRPRRIDEGIPRVLAQALPPPRTFRIYNEILRDQVNTSTSEQREGSTL